MPFDIYIYIHICSGGNMFRMCVIEMTFGEKEASDSILLKWSP
jgi:hypothetical protein